MLTVALGAVWYVFGLILDSHVRSGVALSDGPMQSDIRRIDGDVQQLELLLRVLQNQISAQKYLTVPPKDLKAHSEELRELKKNLEPISKPGTTH